MSGLHILLPGFIASLVFISLVLGVPTTLSTSSESTDKLLTSEPKIHSQIYYIKTCVILQMGAYFKTVENEYISYVDGEIAGNCGNLEKKEGPVMRVSFKTGSLIFELGVNENNSTFVKRIAGEYRIGDKSHTFTTPADAIYFNTTEQGHYYRCDSEQNITMSTEGSLFLSNFGLEVFRTSTNPEFTQVAERCELDSGGSSLLFNIFILMGVFLVILGVVVIFFNWRNLKSKVESLFSRN